ncbi:MAG: 16S rRNA (cytidine(1402)-2'-O)-methyltransferase [Candidatus Gastranaerophilales bacterium]|nr:16S rRNA (cytidine(1402)-2'-O)-methyltransferase [Candidatus Gastranaerophilales bacterium]
MEKILYICPTPIGNLEDITLRAVRILKEADIIACEDTRVTQKLLNHYKIDTKLTGYHKFSEKEKSSYIINLIKNDKKVVLVSDAGTPLISDPGAELVRECIKNDIKIVPLPGACALTTAFCGCFHENENFIFLGFIPRKKNEKEELLRKYSDINMLFYESPNRLEKTLQEILEIRNNPYLTVARELTKIFEEIKRDSAENLYKYYSEHKPKGEIVLIIEPEKTQEIDMPEVMNKAKILQKEGYSNKEISKILSLLTQVPKNDLYKLLLR